MGVCGNAVTCEVIMTCVSTYPTGLYWSSVDVCCPITLKTSLKTKCTLIKQSVLLKKVHLREQS